MPHSSFVFCLLLACLRMNTRKPMREVAQAILLTAQIEA